jgi:hypothetical protein
MHATPLTSVWPPTPQRAVSFIQVSDFMSILLHTASDLAPCEFCRTLNAKGVGRCRVCGGTLPAPREEETAGEVEGKGRRTAPFSDARSLADALVLVLVPALLLFAVFGAWYLPRSQAPVVTREAPALVSAPAAADAAPQASATTELRRRIRADVLNSGETGDLGTLEVESGTPALAPLPLARADAIGARPSAPVSLPAPRSEANRPVSRAPARARQNPLAVCEAANFLARSICVNNRCAEPGAARLHQCREVLRQRRIDEGRRNPMLMG